LPLTSALEKASLKLADWNLAIQMSGRNQLRAGSKQR